MYKKKINKQTHVLNAFGGTMALKAWRNYQLPVSNTYFLTIFPSFEPHLLSANAFNPFPNDKF